MIKPILLLVSIIFSKAYAAPLSNESNFKTYGLHDFCLDITQEVNNKNFDFLLSHIDFNGLEHSFTSNTSFTLHEAMQTPNIDKNDNPILGLNDLEQRLNNINQHIQSNDEKIKRDSQTTNHTQDLVGYKFDFIHLLSKQIKEQLAINLAHFSPNWRNTRFSPINQNSAYCAIIGDPLTSKDSYAYAILLTLENKDNHFKVSDFKDSNLFISYKEIYQHHLAEIFELSLSEKTNSNNYQNSPIYQYIYAVKQQNTPYSISSYQKLNLEQQKNPVLLQMLLNTLQTQTQHNQNELDIVINAIDNQTPSYVLLNIQIDKMQVEQAHRTLKNLEQAFGYHPSQDFYGFLIDGLANSNKVKLDRLLSSLDIDDGYQLTYWILLKELTLREKFDNAVVVLDILKKRFSINFNTSEFLTDKDYKKLIKSKAYTDWASRNY